MTSTQMALEYQILLDKKSSNAYPEILPEEVDIILNKAQEVFIKSRYGLNNNVNKSFEETEKRTNDLKNIIADANINLTNIYFNQFNNSLDTYQIPFSDLPLHSSPTMTQNHWFTVREFIKVKTKTGACKDTVNTYAVKRSTNDTYVKQLQNPFITPKISRPLSLYKEFIELNVGGEINYNVYDVIYGIRYIHEPIKIVSDPIETLVDCKLSEHTHREIVDIAVKITAEVIESIRTQTVKDLILTQE